MKNKPFVTVFTPNYNSSRYISETIESIINQTYSNFEYIIIDDCSTDNSWQIIQEYAKKDNRIKIFRNQKNLHIVRTRNKGFKLSSPDAKYFAILDSDDVALMNRLEVQIKFLENHPSHGLVGSNILVINEDSHIIGFRRYPLTDDEIRKKITRFDPIAQPSVTLRKEVIKEIGEYDIKWKVTQDFDYWVRVGVSWKLANINEPLIKYRLSKTQAKRMNLKETLQNIYKIQKKAVELYGYRDSLYNKLFRVFFKLFSSFPQFIYLIYKLNIMKSRKIYF